MIPLREQEYIRDRFERELGGKLKIDYFTQPASSLYVPGREECQYCEEVGKMLQEIASLTDKIALTVHDFRQAQDEAKKLGVDKVPGIVVRGAANRPLRFFGIPGGNEFPNFIDALVEASKQQVSLAPETSKHLKKLKDDISVDVYVTPTCPHCPAVVRSAFRLALASAHVKASAVEIGEFPRIAQSLGVRAVPYTVLNNRTAIAGAVDETALAEAIVKAAGGDLSTGGAQGGATTATEAVPASKAPPSGLVIPR